MSSAGKPSTTSSEHALRCLVVNAGTHPEPQQLALALAAAGHEVTYLTGTQFPLSKTWSRIMNSAPSRIKSLLESRLLQLTPSDHVKIASRALHIEMTYQLAKTARMKSAPRIMRHRTRTIDRIAGRMVATAARPYDLVISQTTSAASSFAACSQDQVRVLLQPIVRAETLRAILSAESALNPDWAFAVPQLPSTNGADPELAMADIVLAGSSFVAESVRRISQAPVVVANYGTEPYNEPISLRSRNSPEPLRVLFVGQVNQRKGIGYLLDAARALEQEATFTLVGDISSSVRARVAEHRNVRSLGGLSRAQVFEQYRDADILLLPSLAEGFALVVPEAMSTGLPCIVSMNSGSNELIEDGENGLLIPIQDSAAIIAAIRRVLGDPHLLGQLSAGAMETARSASWERFRIDALTGILTTYRRIRAERGDPDESDPPSARALDTDVAG